MTKKQYTDAQNDYMKFWENENEQVQTAAQMAYRAGVVWTVRHLMRTPIDQLAESIVTLHRELTATGQ